VKRTLFEYVAKVDREPMVLKNSGFGANREIYSPRRPSSWFLRAGVGQVRPLALLSALSISEPQSNLTFANHAILMEKQVLRILEFFNTISP